MQIGVFRMAQMIAGASTSGPVFFLGMQSLRTGDITFGAILLFIGTACFFLPGFIMQRVWNRVVALKSKVVAKVREGTLSLLPDWLF